MTVNVTTPAPKVVRVSAAGAADMLEVATFNYSGDLLPEVGKGRYYLDVPCEIRLVRFTLNTAPTGGPATFAVKKNGVSIFAVNPTIPAGANTAAYNSFTATDLVVGDYLTVDVISGGLTVPGADLTVTIRMRRLD